MTGVKHGCGGPDPRGPLACPYAVLVVLSHAVVK